mmetsp:Transcript_4341/g.12320  ORF Transcript_4341/g.12320 Transcript_4341/m.12320 type:complete len:269 (-) Transcript_4341:3189-3995(-)
MLARIHFPIVDACSEGLLHSPNVRPGRVRGAHALDHLLPHKYCCVFVLCQVLQQRIDFPLYLLRSASAGVLQEDRWISERGTAYVHSAFDVLVQHVLVPEHRQHAVLSKTLHLTITGRHTFRAGCASSDREPFTKVSSSRNDIEHRLRADTHLVLACCWWSSCPGDTERHASNCDASIGVHLHAGPADRTNAILAVVDLARIEPKLTATVGTVTGQRVIGTHHGHSSGQTHRLRSPEALHESGDLQALLALPSQQPSFVRVTKLSNRS